MNHPILARSFIPLYLLLIVAIVLSGATGAIDLDFGSLAASLFSADPARTGLDSEQLTFQQSIFSELRAPRILLGFTVGVCLASSGACFQALFKNPLADPAIVGVSAGAATGAISFIVLGSAMTSGSDTGETGFLSLPLAAMVGAMISMLLLFMLSQGRIKFWQRSDVGLGGISTATLILAGIAINALFNAINGVLIFMSDEQQLRELTFWTLGSLARADISYTLPVTIFVLAVSVVNMRHARAMNAIALGDNHAFTMGYDVHRLKLMLLILNTCAVGAVVALSGMIGFVGLVIPHVARTLFGANNEWVIPASFVLGASIMLFADVVARIVVLPAEMPVGVITALIGAPFFMALLLKVVKKP